jgi:hypothetical protein
MTLNTRRLRAGGRQLPQEIDCFLGIELCLDITSARAFRGGPRLMTCCLQGIRWRNGLSGRDPTIDGFVGQAPELALVADAAEAAIARRPVVVWVEGEARLGKTALVRQAMRALPADFPWSRAKQTSWLLMPHLSWPSSWGR